MKRVLLLASILLTIPLSARASSITIVPGASPAGGYLPLSLFGIAPVGASDDGVTDSTVPAFLYAGESWTHVGFASNGFLIVGGGTNGSFSNQTFPDPVAPNNVLAPFWTDLNPTAGGALRVGTLTDGADTWIVFDWDQVVLFGTTIPNSFEVWLGVAGDAHPGEDISFVYGAVGSPAFLTVGAEDKTGTVGASYFFNGAGTRPVNGTELIVLTADLPVPEPVPEPASLFLLGTGLIGAVRAARKRRG